MADEPTPATGTVTAPEPPAKPEEPKVPEGADNPDAVKRALDAERKAAKDAVKRAVAAEAKLAAHEDAQKSELEKAQGQLSKAAQAQADAEAKLLRYEVGTSKEVPAKLFPLLTGASKEELEAQADLILENAKPSTTPDFDGGARDPAPDPKTPEQAHNESLLTAFGMTPK